MRIYIQISGWGVKWKYLIPFFTQPIIHKFLMRASFFTLYNRKKYANGKKNLVKFMSCKVNYLEQQIFV